MKKRLQDLSFRVSRYFRPLDAWHCGGLGDGSQCLLGPDENGNCRAIVGCSPEQQDKTWVCTRSQLVGGPCDAGPSAHGDCGRQRPPCQPVRSIRARRSKFGWLVAAATLALVTLVVSLDDWQGPINPGNLSKHHSAFGATECQACHTAATMPRESWLESLLFSAEGHHSDVSDSDRCIGCHSLGQASKGTHSLTEQSLAALSVSAESRRSEVDGASLFLKVSQNLRKGENDELACKACHSEHQGREADISQVSDRQCAVCHTNSFDSFASHVAFSNYPADKRTQIIFSHNSHLSKHFAEDDLSAVAPTACTDCHVTDSIGRKMEVKGFDATCSGCHAKQVTGENRAGEKGFAMLAIPALDLQTLAERGVKVGEWPEYSDAEFTPLNLLLIAAVNPDLTERLTKLSSLDLYDLSSASDEDLKLVYDAAWSLKQVFFEMERAGARSISRKLAVNLPASINRENEIFGLLSPAVIQQATSQAFPSLETEMLEWLGKGEPPFELQEKPVAQEVAEQAVKSEAEEAIDDDWLSGAVDDDELGADDDDWLAGELDGGDSQDSEDDDWLSGAVDEQESEAEDDDWLSQVAADDETEDDGEDISSDDDWLSDAVDDSSMPLDDEELETAELGRSGSGEDSATAKDAPIPSQLALEDRAAAGGWYYENYYLRYRPSGHADRLIVAWVERLVESKQAKNFHPKTLSGMHKALLGDSTPGSCLKCHSVDTSADGAVVKVNWLGAQTASAEHDFNAFRHQSHFSVVDPATDDFYSSESVGCRSCHEMNADSDSSAAYQDNAEASFESDFHDLDQQRCVSCHGQEQALASCTLCHNYHIGERSFTGIQDSFNSTVKVASEEQVSEANQ